MTLAPLALTPFALTGCGGGESKTSHETPAAKTPGSADHAASPASAEALPFKIGVMTGTVSQGEDEYRGAERMAKRYGDRVKTVTYPDNFMTEQETTIAQLLNLASDSEVKAIVIDQGVPGTIAAIKKVREQRPEMIFVVGNPHEDPNQISQYANLSLITDDLKRGETIIELAHKMGAKTFVHYSFPRHMSQELLARRRDIMSTTCEKLGMKFVSINAPDPTGDQGLPGAQKFILEDVPREISQYGKDTAFFSTNCGMQEPLIRSVLDNGGIFPEQCCPSPTHGYPGALGIAVAGEDAGDMTHIRSAIQAKVAEKGESGRFATWPVSIGIVLIEAATELAKKGVTGEIKLTDAAAISAEIEKAAGASVKMQSFEGKDNYYMVLLESVIF
ncbi:MAG: DUF3798 domain-containing protein [Candidatus Eisenbacteria bacterium]|nr:DUF3798 domain-containing protein [Candidatus Eisenbacteria bacterium]